MIQPLGIILLTEFIANMGVRMKSEHFLICKPRSKTVRNKKRPYHAYTAKHVNNQIFTL